MHCFLSFCDVWKQKISDVLAWLGSVPETLMAFLWFWWFWCACNNLWSVWTLCFSCSPLVFCGGKVIGDFGLWSTWWPRTTWTVSHCLQQWFLMVNVRRSCMFTDVCVSCQSPRSSWSWKDLTAVDLPVKPVTRAQPPLPPEPQTKLNLCCDYSFAEWCKVACLKVFNWTAVQKCGKMLIHLNVWSFKGDIVMIPRKPKNFNCGPDHWTGSLKIITTDIIFLCCLCESSELMRVCVCVNFLEGNKMSLKYCYNIYGQ